MIPILLASLFWAFSFSIIKYRLPGVDPALLAFLRLSISALLFVPFFRGREARLTALALLGVVGALQFGLMYVFYLSSFRFLSASEVVLWTIFTPFWIMLFSNALARKWRRGEILILVIAVAATFLMVFNTGAGYRFNIRGVLLVQLSNICFAGGVLLYKKHLPEQLRSRQGAVFAMMYGGGALLAFGFAIIRSALPQVLLITPGQWLYIFYLGIVPSGLSFYLFNLGASRATDLQVAIGNNLKVPLGILVALIFAGEKLATTVIILGAILFAVALALSMIRKGE